LECGGPPPLSHSAHYALNRTAAVLGRSKVTNQEAQCPPHAGATSPSPIGWGGGRGEGWAPTPSEAGIKVTSDSIRAGQLLKIALLGHVINGTAQSRVPAGAWIFSVAADYAGIDNAKGRPEYPDSTNIRFTELLHFFDNSFGANGMLAE